MSRSNPHENGAPNPASRWFEWSGGANGGTVTYYDKDTEKRVDAGLPFTFALLEQLGGVGGWHNANDSGIYSNQIKGHDSTLVVKSFKGGTIAEGAWRDIKATVEHVGGKYESVLYLAFKDGGEYRMGVLKVAGAALHAWVEFTKKAGAKDLLTKAVQIHGYTEGKKGSVIYRVPEFKLVALSDNANNVAVALDLELQQWLAGYFKRTASRVPEHAQPEPEPVGVGAGSNRPDELDSDSIPF